MLVADPQLLGDRDEPIWPLGAITRLDCDRYLSKTFSLAMAYAERVDAIVFLGDLLDEGEWGFSGITAVVTGLLS